MKKKNNKASENKPKNPYIVLLPSTGGRQRKTLSQAGWDLVTTLSQFQATDEEIATALSGNTTADEDNITVDTLTNEYNGATFSDYKTKGKNRGKSSLRSWQWASARNGNVSMQIFLGKNYLGQSDKAENEVPDTQINIQVQAATAEETDDDVEI